MMKRFVAWFGLGLGLALGSCLVYGLVVSEATRLAAVGVGAFLLAALTIGGTALVVNRQWTSALGSQSHRTVHNHRYPAYGCPPDWERSGGWDQPELLPPPLPQVDLEAGRRVEDEVVA